MSAVEIGKSVSKSLIDLNMADNGKQGENGKLFPEQGKKSSVSKISFRYIYLSIVKPEVQSPSSFLLT